MQAQDDNTDRWFAAFGGIGFGVLTILGWAFWAAPEFPKLTPGVASLSDSPAYVASYYAQNATNVRIGCLLGTIALVPLLCFVVAMYNRLRAAEGGTGSFSLLALISGVMVCVVHFLFLSFLFQAAFRPGTAGVQVTNAMHYAGTAGAAASVLYATMLGSVAVVTLRHGALPRWTGVLAAVATPLQFLYIPSIFGAQHLFDVTVGLLGVYLTFGTFLPWCIAAGIAMMRPVTVGSGVAARRGSDVRRVIADVG
jgi:hypothetical protein